MTWQAPVDWPKAVLRALLLAGAWRQWLDVFVRTTVSYLTHTNAGHHGLLG